MGVPRSALIVAASVLAVTPSVASLPAASVEKVRAAAVVSYVHGMTDEIAAREVGAEGVPALLELLADPEFPRRDNVVAFLAHLPAARSVPRLLEHLERPLGDLRLPANDRALRLVPRALRLIAAAGHVEALKALEELADSGKDGILNRAVAAGRYGANLRRDLRDAAAEALATPGRGSVNVAIDRVAAPELEAADPSPRAHATGITYANHAALVGLPLSAMSDGVLDASLRDATLGTGRSEFPEDVACCHALTRMGSGGTFGAPGDGLDAVDSLQEFQAVVGASPERVKVVRQINWCGSAATNILGCSLTPGHGMVVVRVGDLYEGVLWLHEYGHNVGLLHVADDRYVMYPYLELSNWGLHATECAALHTPPAAAQSAPIDAGICSDDDGDGVVITIDVCPEVHDPSQYDSDRDGAGEACDNCPGVSNPDQSDEDQDRTGEVCDNCPGQPNDQYDFDRDGFGDLCDGCPYDADNDLDADGACGDVDSCPYDADPSQADADGDTRGDACDRCPGDPINDADTDGTCATNDACPFAFDPPVASWTDGLAAERRLGAVATGVGDLDGDGYDDVAVAIPEYSIPESVPALSHAGMTRIFRGSAAGLSATPWTTLVGSRSGEHVGWTVLPAGDVDADGFDDVLVGVASIGDVSGTWIRLYRGGVDGLVRVDSWYASSSSGAIDAGGDFNCDGRADLAIGESSGGLSHVLVYWGGEPLGLGLNGTSIEATPGTSGAGAGTSVAFVRDMDGDGCDELAMSFGDIVEVFFGSPQAPSGSPEWTLDGGGRLASAADIDGDALGDLAVGRPYHRPGPQYFPSDGAVSFRAGNATRTLPDEQILLPSDRVSERFGERVAGVGDVDGDGFDDLAVRTWSGFHYLIQVFRGSAGGLSRLPVWSRGVPPSNDEAGVAEAGDVNGDGFADVLVVAAGVVHVDYGGPGGPRIVSADLDADGLPDACDADDDGDAIDDAADNCWRTPNAGQDDADADSYGDVCDDCPLTFNPPQEDRDRDGIGDACDPDVEGDGVADDTDNCLGLFNPDQANPDADALGSACDNCPGVPNDEQQDSDHDGVGNACDSDLDGDGAPNLLDNCPQTYNYYQEDGDLDGPGDACDACTDADHDGYGRFPWDTCNPAPTRFDCEDTDPAVHPGAFDACDAKDNDCTGYPDDARCSDFVPASFERVDGFALASLGRAFGSCSASPSSEWWLDVDYTGDACVDGDDLSVLGFVWGCSGDVGICP